ncbi:MAG: hypothetical protein SFY81_04675 [Verrucomicrobiota bacterium]|nr:hypothetical protein [Verrucomicrobiota bacterium]
MDDTVKNVLKADPSKIFDQYNAALEMKKAAVGERHWWEKIMDWRAAPMEWVLTAFFYYLGWIASALMWWAYILQSAILFMGYALSPIFIGFLAFPVVQNVGRRYLLHLVGVMVWPLGWGLAGLITDGMIGFMTDRSFLSSGQFAGNEGYSLQNFMGVAFLGVWIIFTTIAAPIFIQRAIQNGDSAAAGLLSGAFGAARAGLATAASTFASGMMGKGGAGMAQAGVASVASAAEAVMGAGLSSGGSLIGSLAQIRAYQEPAATQRRPGGRFPRNDPTGDKTVEALLRRTRNPYSQG